MKNLKRLQNLAFSFLIVGCASAPDVPICVELTPAKSFCTNTISDKDFYISDTELFEGKTYWEIRPTMVLMPASSWAKIKAYIIKSCRQSKRCSNYDHKIDQIDKMIGLK